MLLSRLAERVYWLGRYLERSEDLSRAILAHSRMVLDMPQSAVDGFLPLLELFETPGQPRRVRLGRKASLLSILEVVVLDASHESSLVSVLTVARENARACRAMIPEDAWDTLNPAYLGLLDAMNAPSVSRVEAAMEGVIEACQRINTQLSEAMVRDESFVFVQLGRYIERADMLLRLTQMAETLGKVNDQKAPFADVRWLGMLRAQNAYQGFRREFQGRADTASTLCFLLGSRKFPRSLWFSLTEVSRALEHLPRSEKLVQECEALRAFALPRQPTEPRAYAQGVLRGLSLLSDSLHTTYFPAGEG